MSSTMDNLAQQLQGIAGKDWEVAKKEILAFANATEQAALNGDKTYFENLAEGGGIPVYPEETTLPPETCAHNMEESVSTYWDLVYAMLVLAFVTVMMPYVFGCCRKSIRYRLSSWIYMVSGWVKVICGLLLCTALVPECPVECGSFFCSLSQYNPGPIYGVIVLFVGVFWFIKACTLNMAAKRASVAAANQKGNLHETVALTNTDPDSDEDEEGGLTQSYKDKPSSEGLETPSVV